MYPYGDEQKILTWELQIGRNHPKLIEDPAIAEFESVGGLPDRDGDGVGYQQERDGKPERELPTLAARDAKVASAIERIQPEGTMDQECGIKDEMARDGLPWLEQDEPRGLKGRDGVNAECVIDEMRRRVGK